MRPIALCLLLLPSPATAEEPILPPVTLIDLDQFPTRSDVWRQRALAQAHLNFCRKQRAMNLTPNLPWRGWQANAEAVWLAWDWLAEAQAPCWFGDEYRVQCLSELRRLIGWRAYYSGTMPAPP